MIFYFISLIQAKSPTAGIALSVIIALKLCKNTKKTHISKKHSPFLHNLKVKLCKNGECLLKYLIDAVYLLEIILVRFRLRAWIITVW